jgi:hypothetical protein
LEQRQTVHLVLENSIVASSQFAVLSSQF